MWRIPRGASGGAGAKEKPPRRRCGRLANAAHKAYTKNESGSTLGSHAWVHMTGAGYAACHAWMLHSESHMVQLLLAAAVLAYVLA